MNSSVSRIFQIRKKHRTRLNKLFTFMKPLRFSFCALALCIFPSLEASGQSSGNQNRLSMKETWANIDFHNPVFLATPPDDSRRLFLVDLDGHIYILPEDRESDQAIAFFDISDRTLTSRTQRFTEEGLLGLAFHPRFSENGKFFVNYTQQNPKRSIVSEFTLSKEDSNAVDMKSERILISLRQPYWNHNSGNLIFGPDDGYLYVAFGDGGLRNDPLRFGQNLFSMNGKILRIDVDTRTGSLSYGIPSDNPFFEQDGALPEIWAYGLRNPWGLWFDPPTGLFWCADVGQDLWEEINLVEKGGNYGWSFFEGNQRFGERYRETLPEEVEFVEPLLAYGRDMGFSITGGFVYRGSKFPWLVGKYIYGDYVTGRVWALEYDPSTETVVSNELLYEKADPASKEGFRPNAFCPDSSGEVLALSWDGKIYHFVDSE